MQLLAFLFPQARLIFSITASAIGVKNHFMYTMRGRPKQIPVPSLTPWNNHCGASAVVRPRWASSAVDELLTRVQSAGHLSYLGNALRTLHGHICTSALTSLLFLAPARRWWLLLWWCHVGFQNKSDCLCWVTLPARFSCCDCLCLFICQSGIFGGCFSVRTCFVWHLQSIINTEITASPTCQCLFCL